MMRGGAVPVIVLHIDPGVHGHGLALGRADVWAVTAGSGTPLVTYEPGALLRAAYARSAIQGGRGPYVWAASAAAALVTLATWKWDAVICEMQVIYPDRKDGPRADPNDMIQVAASLGVLLGALRCPVVVGRDPGEWTKGVKKEDRQRTLKAALPAEMHAVIDTRSAATKKDAEDLWDAVGLQRTRGAFLQVIKSPSADQVRAGFGLAPEDRPVKRGRAHRALRPSA